MRKLNEYKIILPQYNDEYLRAPTCSLHFMAEEVSQTIRISCFSSCTSIRSCSEVAYISLISFFEHSLPPCCLLLDRFDLFVSRVRTTIAQARFCQCIDPSLWNKLPHLLSPPSSPAIFHHHFSPKILPSEGSNNTYCCQGRYG